MDASQLQSIPEDYLPTIGHQHDDEAAPFALPYAFILPDNEAGVVTRPIGGVRCPTCAKNGQEVWVIPGKACGYCGTACG